ncbi:MULTISPECIES: DUF1820 family protein [Larsenimonas]|uniref:DUF1820 family protein n=1 Tax=Larsenimonas suaedae TaxID=1851019 RepID=A0ABU1GVR0_9GAMM|nr:MULTISPECIES: DUF1820 family protein [Larsenimonas]MCM2970932.1 DUF1820 family protein [Larsenimonas suaedae]MCM5703038.1 DUF1820 family protein [Larsenimonas salina]MDR5895641.1 DUF1820 family protein [Larsenimonas suaedae]
MPAKSVYRVIFHQQNEVWELYAREIYQSDLWGFLEVEGVVFGDTSSVVVDPSAEKLKKAFEGVQRSYIPMNAIVRIDEVEREGEARAVKASGNVAPFPTPPNWGQRDD